jgi:methylglutaconyl-CoA hydratase
MPIAPINSPLFNVNSQMDFTPLAKLGEQWRTQQADAAKQSVLSQLGSDPAANSALLMRSGIPDLATMGLSIQHQLRGEQRTDAQNAIANQRVSPEGQEGLRAFAEKRPPSWMKMKPPAQ